MVIGRYKKIILSDSNSVKREIKRDDTKYNKHLEWKKERD